jgi:diguanylate cyclase (GGDEF)-like protein
MGVIAARRANKMTTPPSPAGRKQFSSWLALALTLILSMPPMAMAAATWTGIADPIFQHLGVDLDTPDSVDLAIAQDHDGFLWIGTEQGLLRWDGYQYRHYRADRSSPLALADNFVQALHVDSAGTLWIGTLSGGLSRYDRQNDRFVTYSSDTHSLSSVVVRAITDDSAGGVWVATNHGVDEVDPKRGTIRQLHHVDADPSSLPDDNVRALLRDHLGRVWIGTRRGLSYLDPSGRSLRTLAATAPTNELNVISLYEDHDGRIWIGTRAGAYLAVPLVGGASFAVTAIQEAAGDQVLSLIEARPGQMWLGTYGNGILVVDTARLQSSRIHHDPLVSNGLNDDTLWALRRDDSGDIWVATNRGVSRFDPNQNAIMTLIGARSRKNGISDDNVEAVLPLPNGQVWLGLGNSGIDVLDPLVGRIAEFHDGVDLSGKHQPLGEVRALASTASGEVFLCTRDAVYRKTVRAPLPVQIALPGAMTARALAVNGTTLWLGTLDDGVWTLPLAPGAEAQPYARADRLTDPRVTVILMDAEHALWVGTLNGLNYIDLATGRIEQIRASPGTAGAIAAPYVSTLLTDTQGRLWVGTQSGGISILEGHGSQRRVRHLGTAEGLPNPNVDKLLESASGDVWAATDSGLAIIDVATLKVRALGRADGVVIPSYWINAGASTADGTLAFGGTDGMTLVKPQYLTTQRPRPRIVVNEAHFGGQELPWGRFAAGSMIKPSQIQPKSNSLSVEFSALDYAAPESNHYAYQLEGYDSAWTTTDWRHRTAAYTNLPPGKYRLKLRASDRNGNWTPAPLILPIEVLPSWYQTVWFRLASGVVLIGLVSALMRLRTAQLRARQRELEQQVAHQTAQLRERERQLEQLAYFDPLTGLANRRMLTGQFDQLSERIAHQGELVLLLVDLDRFKHINDTLGHDAGDALLVATSQRLTSAVRDAGQVFRLGGDEFAILLVEPADRATVEVICREIIEQVFVTVPYNGVDMVTSPSIGIARFPTDADSLKALLKAADLALYEAKRAGRKTWRWGSRHESR